MTGTIFNIQRFSLHDGPGIRTTVFLKGCPLSCPWCHNPESQALLPELLYWENRCVRCGACVANCPHQAIVLNDHAETIMSRCARCGACTEFCYADARALAGQEMSVKEVLNEIDKDRAFYRESGGGFTLSGGEPLMQAEFAAALLSEGKKRGLQTALDTCGFAAWSAFEQVRGNVDFFLYDLKIMDNRRHLAQIGQSNELILANLRRLAHHEHNILIRVPIIPGFTDDAENLGAIAVFVKSLPRFYPVEILPYHNIAAGKYDRLRREYQLLETANVLPESIHNIKRRLESLGVEVTIGG